MNNTLPNADNSAKWDVKAKQASQRVLRDLQQSRGYTQGRIAKLLGLSQAQVSRILAGTQTLPLSAALRADMQFGANFTDAPRPSVSKSVDYARKGWSAYVDAHQASKTMELHVRDLLRAFFRLSPHASAEFVRNCPPSSLKLLDQGQFSSTLEKLQCPPVDRHPQYRGEEPAFLVSQQAMSEAKSLLSKWDGLDPAAKELVFALMERLCPKVALEEKEVVP